MLSAIQDHIQTVARIFQDLIGNMSLPLQIIIGLVCTLVVIATCILFAIIFRKSLSKVLSDSFPKTVWTQHIEDVTEYNDFSREYNYAIDAMKVVSRNQRESALKHIQHLLLVRNVDFMDFPNGTFTSRVKGLPNLPKVSLFDTNELPKGFRYVTNPGKFKNFKRMKRWHTFLNLLCIIPILLLELMLCILVIEFFAMLFVPVP